MKPFSMVFPLNANKWWQNTMWCIQPFSQIEGGEFSWNATGFVVTNFVAEASTYKVSYPQ
jgi:hypothetical protein